jgi:membrane protease YdiL (CAAX protease family)
MTPRNSRLRPYGSAIQNLLHSRWLYAGLVMVLVLVYAAAPALRIVRLSAADEPAAASSPLWAESVDQELLKRALAKEPWLVVLTLCAMLVFMSFGVFGFIFSMWGLLTGRIHSIWRFPKRRLPVWSLGEFGRILFLAIVFAHLLLFLPMMLHPDPAGHVDPFWWTSVSMLILDGLVILTILLFASGKGTSIRRVLGLADPRASASIAVGMRSYLAMFPWLFVMLLAIVEITRAFGWQPPIEPIQRLIFQQTRPDVLALVSVLACVVGPAAEELFFRGVLYASLRQKTSRFAAMLISSAAFAALHTNVVGFLPIMVLGAVLAYIYERTGSLIGSLAVHIMHNTLLISLALLLRRLLLIAG